LLSHTPGLDFGLLLLGGEGQGREDREGTIGERERRDHRP